MELIVNEIAIPEKIEFNYEDLKAELQTKAQAYASIVYTEDQIKEAKADKASLNKLKKALNDERIRREREYMAPFNEFKAQINDIIAIINEPILAIDTCLGEYEDRRKETKLAEVKIAIGDTDFPDFVKFEQIFDEKWLNASVTMKSIKDALKDRKNQIDNDVVTIGMLPYSFEAMEVYRSSLDINKAIAEGNRLADIQRRKEEAERAKAEEAERQRQAELLAKTMPEPIEPEVEAEGMAVEGPTSPVESVEDPGEAVMWVSFKACLTRAQAVELREFFVSRGIEFGPI